MHADTAEVDTAEVDTAAAVDIAASMTAAAGTDTETDVVDTSADGVMAAA